MDAQIFKISKICLKIVGTKWVTWCQFHTEKPQTVIVTLYNFFAVLTWCPWFVHPWPTVSEDVRFVNKTAKSVHKDEVVKFLHVLSRNFPDENEKNHSKSRTPTFEQQISWVRSNNTKQTNVMIGIRVLRICLFCTIQGLVLCYTKSRLSTRHKLIFPTKSSRTDSHVKLFRSTVS
jgi:hypothetical protein